MVVIMVVFLMMLTGCEQESYPTSIALSHDDFSLEVGEDVGLSAMLSPSDTTYDAIEWSSSDSEIVSVNVSGRIVALDVGEATITATTENDIKASVVVNTYIIPASAFTLPGEIIELELGDSYVLPYTITPDDATYDDVSWSSSDASIVYIRDEGEVIATGLGEATITAETNEGHTDTVQIIVRGMITQRRLQDYITSHGEEQINLQGESIYSIVDESADFQLVFFSEANLFYMMRRFELTGEPGELSSIGIFFHVSNNHVVLMSSVVTFIESITDDDQYLMAQAMMEDFTVVDDEVTGYEKQAEAAMSDEQWMHIEQAFYALYDTSFEVLSERTYLIIDGFAAYQE